jgi:hypothetical protein
VLAVVFSRKREKRKKTGENRPRAERRTQNEP